MKIETKYSIGEKVYIVFKEDTDSFVKIFKDNIQEIVVQKNKILYYAESFCEEFEEDEIVPYSRKDLLVTKINELLESDKDERTT